jgi:hypothetical protein
VVGMCVIDVTTTPAWELNQVTDAIVRLSRPLNPLAASNRKRTENDEVSSNGPIGR